MSTTTSRTSARALSLIAALVLTTGLFIVSLPGAQATTSPTGTTPSPAPVAAAATPPAKPRPTKAQIAKARAKAFDARVLKIVSSRRGSPYVYGASGPHRFDCSGLTMWTFKKLHRRLPHSAAAQYGRVKHLGRSHRRAGDLVFFHDGGGIYHVAIYAGHNQVWHAPYSGTRVRKERLWTSAVYYGRVR